MLTCVLSDEACTPTLTGIGERRHLLNREIDLGTHIQDVLSVIDYEDLSELVLVGHSTGEWSSRVSPMPYRTRSPRSCYLDAFVPEDGQSLFGMLPPDRPHATAPGEEWLTAPLPVEVFGKASQQVCDFIARKGMSQPTACFSQPVKLAGGIDRISRKTYIYCNDPEPRTFTPFYEKLKSLTGWTVHTRPCSHFVQMDMPEELTAMLRATTQST